VTVCVLVLKGGAGSFLEKTVTPDPVVAENARKGMLSMVTAGRKLAVTTWNIAAINNNPFEYWITYKGDPQYEKLMVDVEQFLENPGDKDVPVSQVFTEEMFAQLDKQLTEVGKWKSVKNYWDEYKKRNIVSGFLKDKLLGKKRLASMPDRITNTINVDSSDEPVCRPTVINQYGGDLSTLDKWWTEWQRFMFVTPLKMKTKDGVEEKIPYQLLKTIKNAKYPMITLQEEEDSLPLQTMCAAIFDAILVHMMNTVSPPETWQGIRRTLVENLNRKKTPHTLDILERVYIESDIITLQEVASSFIETAKTNSKLGNLFHIAAPTSMDGARDQNSVILLKKTTFPRGIISEISAQVEGNFPPGEKVPVDRGDVLAVTTASEDGIPFVVASFHGDTNGMATKPVLDALMKTMNSDPQLISHKLVFGLDANTYENAVAGEQQSVVDFGKFYQTFGLTSCWGDTPDPKNYTTYNARTYLQTQLNKACKKSEQREKGDVNPKDFILFRKGDFKVEKTWKDNTGEKTYTEDSAFPTLDFPSDHGLLSTILEPIKPKSDKV